MAVLRRYSRIVDAALRLFDVLVLAVALPAARNLRDVLLGDASGSLGSARYLSLLAVTVLCWFVTSWMFEVYGAYRTRPISVEVSRIGRAMAVSALVIAAGGYFAKQQDVSRLFVGLYFVVASALLLANRLALRRFARSVRRRGYNTRRFAVVGTGDLADEVVANMAEHPEWGFQFAGYVLENGKTPAWTVTPVPGQLSFASYAPAAHVAEESTPGPILGHLSRLGELLEQNVLDEIIFAVSRDHLDVIQPAVRLCEEQGVEVKICLNFFQAGIGRMSMDEVSGLPALAFTTTPTDEVALVLKRVFDIAVSAIMLVLVAPLFAAVAVAIRLDSPGPIFFRQRRVGLRGRDFVFYKFRSMCVDAEAKLESLRQFNEVTGPVFKMKQDPRVTRVGQFLRRTSLDELPQFWNVLKGEMSVVGPRPPTPDEVLKYKPWQRRRLSMKPGITCTWQVSGRSNVDFDRWMQLDLAYIDNWSLWHDMQICFRTIPAVLTSRGAH
jgi:exopolysaccharide biosynthesis polyprenyl glycosylphosphotransferase